MPSYDNKVLTGDQLVYFSGLIKTALAAKANSSALAGKQDALVFNTAYNASSNKVATMSDIPDISGKQDSLVFNTAYNASSNKVATMADIPAAYTLPVASTSTLGGVKVDGSTITIDNNGVISASGSGIELTAGSGIDIEQSVGTDEYVISIDPTGLNFEDEENGYISNISPNSFSIDSGEHSVFLSSSLMSTTTFTVPEDEEDVPFIENQTTIQPGEIMFSRDVTEGETESHILAVDANGALTYDNSIIATTGDITNALSRITNFSFEIVSSLPVQDISSSKIYLVAKQTSGTNQVYTEYAYINNAWEIIGDTAMTIDTLSNAEVSTIWSTATATV